MSTLEDIKTQYTNVRKKISEVIGVNPNDVDWAAYNNLMLKKAELEKRISDMQCEAAMVDLFSNAPAPTPSHVEHDMVNHPRHYEREGALQCIDEMEMIFGKEQLSIWCKLNTWKYRYRAADKNGKEDIAKSDWYMRKYRELTNGKA